jgi:hypothetical protein
VSHRRPTGGLFAGALNLHSEETCVAPEKGGSVSYSVEIV